MDPNDITSEETEKSPEELAAELQADPTKYKGIIKDLQKLRSEKKELAEKVAQSEALVKAWEENPYIKVSFAAYQRGLTPEKFNALVEQAGGEGPAADKAGEKVQEIMDGLDPKARALVEASMQVANGALEEAKKATAAANAALGMAASTRSDADGATFCDLYGVEPNSDQAKKIARIARGFAASSNRRGASYADLVEAAETLGMKPRPRRPITSDDDAPLFETGGGVRVPKDPPPDVKFDPTSGKSWVEQVVEQAQSNYAKRYRGSAS